MAFGPDGYLYWSTGMVVVGIRQTTRKTAPFTSGESYTMNGGERSDNIMVSRTADFNGDGKAEIAVFRPANSTWYIRGLGDFVYSTVGDISVLPITTGMGRQTLLSSGRLKANGTEVLL